MKIELSQDELETINAALECWEKDASTGALFGEMLTMMITPKEHREEAKLTSSQNMAKARQEGAARKLKSLMIRAKLAKIITEMMTSGQI